MENQLDVQIAHVYKGSSLYAKYDNGQVYYALASLCEMVGVNAKATEVIAAMLMPDEGKSLQWVGADGDLSEIWMVRQSAVYKIIHLSRIHVGQATAFEFQWWFEAADWGMPISQNQHASLELQKMQTLGMMVREYEDKLHTQDYKQLVEKLFEYFAGQKVEIH